MLGPVPCSTMLDVQGVHHSSLATEGLGQLMAAEEMWAAPTQHWRLCHPPGPASVWQHSNRFSCEHPSEIQLFSCKEILYSSVIRRESFSPQTGAALLCTAHHRKTHPGCIHCGTQRCKTYYLYPSSYSVLLKWLSS